MLSYFKILLSNPQSYGLNQAGAEASRFKYLCKNELKHDNAQKNRDGWLSFH